MRFIRMKYLVLMILCFATNHTRAQLAQVPAQPNRYTAIESILASHNNDVDSVVVSSVAGFDVGDTVMVYCVKGSGIYTSESNENEYGDIRQSKYTGKYAFLIIDEIAGNTVVLNASFNRAGVSEIGPLEEG